MELTPEQLEKMRTIGLKLDRSGTFWHDGAPVTHPRLRQALLRWLDVLDDGRDIVRLDDKRHAYVEIEDAHLRALSARWEGDRCLVLWDDDQGGARLRVAPPGARSRVLREGARQAARPDRRRRPHAVTERIVEDRGFKLVAAGTQWPIARRRVSA